MGYCATGGGYPKLKKFLPEYTIRNANEIFDYVNLTAGDTELDLTYDGKYYGDEVENWAVEASQFIKEGSIDFCGEDDSHWRYTFDDGRWEFEDGRIVFDSDPALELSEDKKQELLDEIIGTIVSGSFTDGKPSVDPAAPTNETKRRLSDVLHKWRVL